MEEIIQKLQSVYKDKLGNQEIQKVKKLLNSYPKDKSKYELSQEDSFLITYGDTVLEDKVKGFETLFKLLDQKFDKTIKNVHILPMYPYTSDDGFSVTDYEEIRQDLGSWEELQKQKDKYGLMYDFVINHISQESEWFKDFLNNKNNYFIEYDESFDTSKVVRPRVSPLFHSYGEKKVWTTFSEDQIDLNFKEFNVFLESTRILLDYCLKGGRFIRLDAIGFLWKESGTTCIHLEQTHSIIKIWRMILDYVFGDKFLITETNVPHKENIEYFANSDEAHMVYNFALPPMVAHTILKGNATHLNKWLSTLESPENCTYFNFLSSHDGIGMRPVENLLPKEEISHILNSTVEKGGKISYKMNPDGTKDPYECNINYYSLLKEGDSLDVKRFLTSMFILNSISGCPAIYIHSILGSENYIQGVEDTGINRRINREQLKYKTLISELENPDADRYKIFNGIKEQINIRKQNSAFSPSSKQESINYGEKVFSIIRKSPTSEILCIANITNEQVTIDKDIKGFELFTKKQINKNKIQPYEYLWIERENNE